MSDDHVIYDIYHVIYDIYHVKYDIYHVKYDIYHVIYDIYHIIANLNKLMTRIKPTMDVRYFFCLNSPVYSAYLVCKLIQLVLELLLYRESQKTWDVPISLLNICALISKLGLKSLVKLKKHHTNFSIFGLIKWAWIQLKFPKSSSKSHVF